MAGVTVQESWGVWPVRCLGELSGLDGIREEGSGIMLCLGLRNVKAAGCVWSLPASSPSCRWGEGVEAGFTCSASGTRKNRLSVFTALEETDNEWQEAAASHVAGRNAPSWSNLVTTRMSMESSLWWNIRRPRNVICFLCAHSSPIVSVAGRFNFYFSGDTEILFMVKKCKHYNSR